MVFPKLSQWKQIGKLLKKSEKITLLVLFLLTFSSLSFLGFNFYFNNTKKIPAIGGNYVEGIVGQPRFLNPIYGEVSDVDRTITGVIFSGLVTYDKNGQIINDLAESFKISEDGKTYDFIIKNNVFWHDGEKLTTDDIVFTIKTIQNSDYKSPQRVNWIDIDVLKNSDTSITFKLKNTYNSFLENCTVKIIPEHIWENILPENFTLSAYNLKPIGSGPYKFSSIEQQKTGVIQKINLISNHKYYNQIPYISEFSFQFFDTKENLIKSANQRMINGFSLTSFDNNQKEAEKEITQNWSKTEKFSVYSFTLPRYFAVFFNLQKQKLLFDDNLRQSLSLATDKQAIAQSIKDATKSEITEINSPILPNFFGLAEPTKSYEFNLNEAKSLLDKSGFKESESGQRIKEIKKTPAFQFKNYLSNKSKGTEVTELQKCLAKLGFSSDLANETNGTYGLATENAVTNFQTKYLPSEKPTGEVGKATRTKLNELCITNPETFLQLKITLTTINQPQLLQTANILKDQWQKIGFIVDVNAVELSDLKSIIKERNYDALLYGQALGSLLDLYPFWHSSQIYDPGLNLSEYQNKDVDALIKDARENLDLSKKQKDLEKLQDIIIQDVPSIFLYSQNYIYWVSEKVLGIQADKIIDPAKRFADVSSWYIKTKRVWQ
jgi:peptide/nickel transport system substrate-binding protein